MEQLSNFKNALNIDVSNSHSHRAKNSIQRVQFGDVFFYRFLEEIGLMSNKSKVLGRIDVPQKFFWHFLRGSFDGDGTSYSYWDKRWKSSFMFYTEFVSASPAHILWIQDEIYKRVGVKGHITGDGRERTLQLKYAKADSLKVLRKLYPNRNVMCLKRKRLKIERILGTVGESLGGK